MMPRVIAIQLNRDGEVENYYQYSAFSESLATKL